MIAALRNGWLAVVLGTTLGLVLLPAILWITDEVTIRYDQSHPVVEMQASILERRAGSVTVRLTGTKIRACSFVSIAGYLVASDGVLDQINMQRMDRVGRGLTRPVGVQDFGDWMLWPTDNAQALRVWTTHQCGVRLVQRMVVEVPL